MAIHESHDPTTQPPCVVCGRPAVLRAKGGLYCGGCAVEYQVSAITDKKEGVTSEVPTSE